MDGKEKSKKIGRYGNTQGKLTLAQLNLNLENCLQHIALELIQKQKK